MVNVNRTTTNDMPVAGSGVGNLEELVDRGLGNCMNKSKYHSRRGYGRWLRGEGIRRTRFETR